jgi:hypothetical protein
MAIEGVNSRMTPLQFAATLSRSRTVETSDSASSDAPSPDRHAPTAYRSQPAADLRPHSELPPATFHWSYRPVRTNGKPAAKRVPQFADSAYWSLSLNSLG